MKKTMQWALLGLVGLLAFTGCATTTNNGYSKQKVVYHVNYDDPKQQTGALRNIQNHINAVGADKLDLKVVVHGNGLSMVLYPEAQARTKLPRGNADEAVRAQLRGLREQGVQFQVCANTVRSKGVTVAEDLFDVDGADVVPSGVVALAELQSAGYAYIKP